MKRFVLSFSACLITTFCLAQTNLKVGAPAPNINVTQWLLNTPQDTSLAGKFIVLEFWATWCKPCLNAVPHMNDLREAFPREDLYFISITDESPEQARAVFDKVDFQSIVVTDEYEETQRNFGNGSTKLSTYPFTVLIDDDNVVRWYGSPKDLDEEKLGLFLAKEPIVAKAVPQQLDPSEELGVGERFVPQKLTLKDYSDASMDSTVTWLVNIREIDDLPEGKGARAVWMPGRGGHTEGSSLREIFEYMFPEQKLVLPMKYESRVYTFTCLDKQPNRDSPGRIRTELFAQLGLVAEERTEKGWLHIMTINDPGLLQPSVGKRFTRIGRNDLGMFAPEKVTLADVAGGLVQFTDHDWVFRGKDKKKYDFEISLNDRETTIADLERYGLKVKTKPTKIPVVRVKEVR